MNLSFKFFTLGLNSSPIELFFFIENFLDYFSRFGDYFDKISEFVTENFPQFPTKKEADPLCLFVF